MSSSEREALLSPSFNHGKRPDHIQSKRNASTTRSSQSPGARRRSYENGNAAAERRYYNEYDDGDQGFGSESALSYVSLDLSPTYARIVASHVLSLLPCLALFLATVMLAWHAPCHIHSDPSDRTEERKMCRKVLSDRVSLSAFGIGIVCWLAAYSLRPAVWKVIHLFTDFVHFLDIFHAREAQEESQQVPPSWFQLKGAMLFFVICKTIALEMLRLFSVLLVNSLVIAGMIRTRYGNDVQKAPPIAHWGLHWYDPRFTVGVWLAIGWAITEFLVTSWQTFNRLALYEDDFDVEERYEEEAHDERVPSQPVFDVNSSADFSDSAATVRARSYESDTATPGSKGSIKDDGIRRSNGTSGSTGLPEQEGRPRVWTENSEVRMPQGARTASGLERVYGQESQWNDLREKLDAEMDILLKARTKVELEAMFGQPLTSIPILLCTLWRIDGWLWNLGSTLLMSASVTLAQGPLVGASHAPMLFPPLRMSTTTLVVVISLHTLFTSIWTLALPRLGFASVTYASMLAGVGLCVSAWGRWGLLI